MRGTGSQVKKKGLLRINRLLVGNVLDRLIGQQFVDVPGIGLDVQLGLIFPQFGVPLVGGSGVKSVEMVETPASRPAVETCQGRRYCIRFRAGFRLQWPSQTEFWYHSQENQWLPASVTPRERNGDFCR
jgi:hypothetical protein